jgi:hypothetical protein
MKIRLVVPILAFLMVASSCGGSSGSSDVTMGKDAVSTSSAPKSNTNFCKNAASALGAIGTATEDENIDANPEKSWKLALSLAMKMLDDAPSEIENEVKLLQKGISGYASIFAKYDYDMMAIAMDPQATAAIEALDAGGKLTAANEALDAYLAEKCGIPQGS